VTKPLRVLLLAAAVLGTLVGCSGHQTLHAIGPDGHRVTATYVGPISHRAVLKDANLIFDPPGKEAPAITAKTLFAGCRTRSMDVCASGVGTTTIYLVRSNILELGGNDGLAYVIVSKHLTCISSGPGPNKVHTDCYRLDVVGANTGDILYEYESSGPDDALTVLDEMH
jgi:hypothetical protein